MEQFKKVQVVMLPTENPSKLCLHNRNLHYVIDGIFNYNKIKYNLYFISDDEIKEGDWIYESEYKTVSKANYNGDVLEKKFKKIIATTDDSLEYCNLFNSGQQQLMIFPQPSQEFIEEYIESYNKGDVITDVLVEYSPSSITIQTYSGQSVNDNLKTQILKINPDNTIIIKKVKDNYSREEVVRLCEDAFLSGNSQSQMPSYSESIEIHKNNWIKENL